MEQKLEEIRATLKKYNQEQLLNGYEKLDENKTGQKRLLMALDYMHTHRLRLQ